MTLTDLYALLESNTFYAEEGMNKFSFANNSIHIDRRALIPFSIYKQDNDFILDPETAIASEKELRIEVVNGEAKLIHFYGKNSGKKLLTLNEYL
jgi:hypothetical protein